MNRSMKRTLIGCAIVAVFTGAGVLLVKVANGPRMYHQESIRLFEAEMPLPPRDSVPVCVPAGPPGAEEAAHMVNPLAATMENIGKGRTYYGYYCRFCHGDDGRGETDVAEGYLPKPARLDAPRVAQMGDGELVRAMLLGTGHQPVLGRIVPPEAYWPLSLFVRTLERENREPEPGE